MESTIHPCLGVYLESFFHVGDVNLAGNVNGGLDLRDISFLIFRQPRLLAFYDDISAASIPHFNFSFYFM